MSDSAEKFSFLNPFGVFIFIDDGIQTLSILFKQAFQVYPIMQMKTCFWQDGIFY